MMGPDAMILVFFNVRFQASSFTLFFQEVLHSSSSFPKALISTISPEFLILGRLCHSHATDDKTESQRSDVAHPSHIAHVLKPGRQPRTSGWSMNSSGGCHCQWAPHPSPQLPTEIIVISPSGAGLRFKGGSGYKTDI